MAQMKKPRSSAVAPTVNAVATEKVHPLYASATVLQRQGKLQDALSKFQRILDDQNDHLEALRAAGMLHIQLEQYEAAALKLARLISLDSGIPEVWSSLATALSMLEKPEQALACVNEGLQLDPASPFAHNTKGTILRALGRPDEALACYEQALRLDPTYGEAWNNKGVALLDLDRPDESVTALKRASQLNPRSAPVLVNLGNALRDLGHYDEAAASYRKALASDPTFQSARFNESMMQLSLSDFANGWKNYEARWQSKGFPSPQRNFACPLWLGQEPLQGKAILLHSEQGFGDTIQFCRYIPHVSALAATTIVEVEAPLTKLLRTLHPDVIVVEKGQTLPVFDAHCPLMSLPLAFDTTTETVPSSSAYLTADPELVRHWEKRLGTKRGPRIGIAWSGNPRHINDRKRSIPLQTLLSGLPINAPGIEWISLQKDGSAIDLSRLEQTRSILHVGQEIQDFADTAALVSLTDIVISVDTAIAHLAGAMGKTVWLLLPYVAEWRWMHTRADSPWYPGMRIFRQPSRGNWPSLLQQVHAALSEELGERVGNGNVSVDTDIARWSDPDSLDAAWDSRAEVAAQYIPDGARVLDIGCGKMALERFLPKHCFYQPCDVVKRDARTITCDLNRKEFPSEAVTSADIITLLGVIEYVKDLPAMFAQLRASGREVVVTYHTTNMTAGLDRNALGWLNHLSNSEIAKLFLDAGFSVLNIEKLSDIQLLFRLSPSKRAKPTPRRVAVLSYANVGNFGDRLGFHMLHSVLPANAIVDHFYFKPWNLPNLSEYDLLVLGIGNSLFAPIMIDELEQALDQVKHSIGIFGTQYRNEIDRARMARIIGKLDRWYARHQEDISLFGKDHGNVVHFGDWLIDAFPMATPSVATPLVIDDTIWQDLPLDRTIQQIQRHRTVVSSRLHPLLCALTSADTVQYSEQRESGNGQVSGKFRSMLLDIFGRNQPENVAWAVDKQKVLQYKQQISENMKILRQDLANLLNG